MAAKNLSMDCICGNTACWVTWLIKRHWDIDDLRTLRDVLLGNDLNLRHDWHHGDVGILLHEALWDDFDHLKVILLLLQREEGP